MLSVELLSLGEPQDEIVGPARLVVRDHVARVPDKRLGEVANLLHVAGELLVHVPNLT